MPHAKAPDRKVTVDVDSDIPPALQLDYAPESFCLSKDAELDWLDQNAFIERKNSAKASNSTNPNSNTNSIYVSNHHSANLKSFFGFPKARKPNYAEAKNRRAANPASIHFFPNSVGRKTTATLSEPPSPKVSCMGRVRSRKDRKRQTESKMRTVFWNNFRSICRSKAGWQGNRPDGEPVVPFTNERKKCSELTPGLGAAIRLTSGRRSDGWASERDMKSEPLDESRRS